MNAFKMLLPSFAFELEKLSAPNYAPRVEKHLRAEDKDWAAFEKGLRAKGFRAAVLLNPNSDAKLKKYTEAYGGYLASKDVAGVVPSRTSNTLYKVKRLKDGRLACGCKDWQYMHSHQGTDCDHIEELKPNLAKTSSIIGGIALARQFEKAKAQNVKGKMMRSNVERLYAGQPLVPVRK